MGRVTGAWGSMRRTHRSNRSTFPFTFGRLSLPLHAMRKMLLYCCSAILLVTGLAIRAEENQLICHQHFAGAIPSDSSEARKYSPSRQVDILHLALDITP